MPIFRAGGKKLRLAYCTNVHPGETLEAIEANLDRYAVSVRDRIADDVARLDASAAGTLGVGLWLAAPVAKRLADDEAEAARFKRFLEERRLVCFTLNAFPFGGFHAERVKHAVYEPAWDQKARAQYTLDAAQALGRILPASERRGTISTLPLGWRGPGGLPREALDVAWRRVDEVVRALSRLEDETGKRIRLLLEPEPGCWLERSIEVDSRFCAIIEENSGICLDCCHQAVMGESVASALRSKAAFVGKVHLSSAVVARVRDLATYDEPRYLHQLVTVDRAARADDLEDVVRDPSWAERRVRVHFHVPLDLAALGAGLETTQPEVAEALDEVLSWRADRVPDLEVETYTWSVLPAARAPGFDLAEGIAAELRWVLARIEAHVARSREGSS